MSLFASMLWDVLTAAGGTLAFALIGVIALGISATALIFAGSAVVALERFARVARRTRSIVICGSLWSLGVGAAAVHLQAATFADLPDDERGLAWLATLLGAAGVVALAIVVLHVVLRRARPTRLANATTLLLGLALSAVLGGSGNLLFAVAPVFVVGLGALGAARHRHRTSGGAPGEMEIVVRILAASLAVGAVLALVLPGPEIRIAMVGSAILNGFVAVILVGLVPIAMAGIVDSRLSAEWFIAARYLVAKRRQTFISVITGICVVGIAAGVWLIITVLSVMNGFERTWRDEIIGNRAHFTVHNGLGPIEDYRDIVDIVAASPGVIGASPYLDADGMVRGAAGEIMAVRVRGIDPMHVADVTDLRADLVVGSLESLEPANGNPDEPSILIGSQLAASLGVTAGDPILLISPFGGPATPLGPAPRLKRFQVSGVFESSFFQYDEMFTYVNLAAAQDFRRVGDVVDGIEGRTTDFYRSRSVADGVQAALGFPYYTRDWKEFFPAFFQALKSERVMMFILLMMIMAVAGLSIVSTLVMMIMEKSGDIAILKAMGAENDAIERIFALEGTLIGLVGTALGVVAGISVTAQIEWIQRQIESVLGIDTLPASVYMFSTLPAEFDVGQIGIAVGVAMMLALGATLLPSRQAARLDPVESLRYE